MANLVRQMEFIPTKRSTIQNQMEMEGENGWWVPVHPTTERNCTQDEAKMRVHAEE